MTGNHETSAGPRGSTPWTSLQGYLCQARAPGAFHPNIQSNPSLFSSKISTSKGKYPDIPKSSRLIQFQKKNIQTYPNIQINLKEPNPIKQEYPEFIRDHHNLSKFIEVRPNSSEFIWNIPAFLYMYQILYRIISIYPNPSYCGAPFL